MSLVLSILIATNSAIKIDPEFATAYYRRGILYKRTEQLKKAEEDFLKALELNEEDYDAMIELGFIRIQAGKKDAIKYFVNFYNN